MTTLEFSQQFDEIAKALLAVQRKLGKVAKTASNPYFGSKYADFESIAEAVKVPLNEEALFFQQGASSDETGRIIVDTMLVHVPSCQYVRCSLGLKPQKPDPQAAGSAITYARRYALQTLCGLVTEDDDGNAASQSPARQEDYVQKLTHAVADKDSDRVTAFLVSRGTIKPTETIADILPDSARRIFKVLGRFRQDIDDFQPPAYNGTELATTQEVAA